MITFKSFLTEAPKFNLGQFKKDCAPILSTLKKGKGHLMMYHGTKNYPDDFRIVQWKPREGPRDSDRDMHKRVNEFFEDKFGAPARNWMFVSGEREATTVYALKAPTCIVFPIGDFEWLQGDHEDLHDMTSWHSRIESQITSAETKHTLSYDEISTLATNHMINKMNHMKWRFNIDLEICLRHGNEIMLKCDKFYLVNENSPVAEEIMNYLTSSGSK